MNTAIDRTPIAVDSIEKMTNKNNIYVNTKDGYWYYYDELQAT